MDDDNNNNCRLQGTDQYDYYNGMTFDQQKLHSYGY
jgi:hypothetical protein